MHFSMKSWTTWFPESADIVVWADIGKDPDLRKTRRNWIYIWLHRASQYLPLAPLGGDTSVRDGCDVCVWGRVGEKSGDMSVKVM